MRIDLHSHSCYSDGKLSPAELVARATQMGLDILALTDHDNTAGLAEAKAAAAGTRLRIVEGLELTTRHEGDVHLLAYFPGSPGALFGAFLSEIRGRRVDRMTRMLENLARHGIRIPPEEVLSQDPRRSVGRPHLARSLVRHGHASDMDDAFRRYLRPGGIAYVCHEVLSPREGVRRIREAGGASVVAHPGAYADDRFIEELVPLGLAGIEAYHSDNQGKVETYLDRAKRSGLAATGGSDFHALGAHRNAELGQHLTPEDQFDRLMKACGR